MTAQTKQRTKLLLFDLDGTLLQDDKTISQRTLGALEKCRGEGVLIGVATSRSEENCMTFLQRLQPDVLISSGGALVKYLGSIIYRETMMSDEEAQKAAFPNEEI